jgi:hypothetical protein
VITPAAIVPLAVKRNWRRFGCSSFEEGLSFSIVDGLAGGSDAVEKTLDVYPLFLLDAF